MNIEQESVILKLYEKVEQEMSNSKEYHQLLSKFNILREQFNKEISLEKQEELSKLMQLRNDMESVETKEYFKKGFKLAIRLMSEALYKEDT